jgi:V/A-type H+-transporting ATPase subunit B
MDFSALYIREGRAISKAKGSLLIAESIPGIKFNEMVDVHLGNGEVKSGQAIDISEDATIVEVFGGVSEVDLVGTTIRCKGDRENIQWDGRTDRRRSAAHPRRLSGY